MLNKRIGIIGCGNMGAALVSRLSGALGKNGSLRVSEIDAAKRDVIQKRYGIIAQTDNKGLVSDSDVIILAIKPKDFDKVLREDVRGFITKDKVLISIAAGVTTEYIEKMVGKGIPVIRVMPNMPAIIGEGISSISAGSSAAKENVALAKEIFSAVGDVAEVDESLIDNVTAISGSGPAYFFYIIEALIEAAEELGLSRETAKRLVFKTAFGSAKLLDELQEEAHTLRARVTSKGGTTEAALRVFEDKKIKAIIKDAVNEAAKRAKELSGG